MKTWIALACLAAGVGCGAVGRDVAMLVVAAIAVEPAPAQPAAIDTRIDVSALVPESTPTAASRHAIARLVDGMFVADGNEVMVRALGRQSDVLEIRALGVSRVSTYQFAARIRFTPLKDVGFRYLLVTDGDRGWGYDVAAAVEEGRLLGPISNRELGI